MTASASGTSSSAGATRAKADLRELLSNVELFRESAYIGGEWVTATRTIEVRNPANGETVGRIPDLGAAETAHAIAAAGAALQQWRALPAAKRSQLLEAWYAAILDHTDDLARILTVEQGKPLAESR